MTRDIFGTRQTNILAYVVYSEKLINSELAHSRSTQVTEINTLDQITLLVGMKYTTSLAVKTFS